MTILPARRPDLIVRWTGDEAIVVDTGSNQAMALTPDAARVFADCDGRTRDARAVVELGEVAVRRAVIDLTEAGLLVGAGVSRRTALIGGVAGAGAIAAMIALPDAAAAVSPGTGATTGTGGGPATPTSHVFGSALTARAATDTLGGAYLLQQRPTLPAGTITAFKAYVQRVAAANRSKMYFVIADAASRIVYTTASFVPTVGRVVSVAATVPVLAGWKIGYGFELFGTVPFDNVPASAGTSWVAAFSSGPPAIGSNETVNNPQGGGNRAYSIAVDITY